MVAISIHDEFEELEKIPDRAFVERRKKPDWVVRGATIGTVLGWLFAVLAFVMLDRAAPATANFFTYYFQTTVVSSWNTTLIRWAFAAILISIVASGIGLILTALRKRRKEDRYPKSLIAACILSMFMLVVFLLNYAEHLT